VGPGKSAGARALNRGVVWGLAALATAAVAADKFGHRPYPVAPPEALVAAGTYRATGRVVRMRQPAAVAFRAMAAAAKTEGLSLVPVSGHRTLDYQRGLFRRAVRRYGTERKAARWVAPPGHSEHHTGWTLDLGDGDRPATDIETVFEATPVFAWLVKNAAAHGFELSFPKGNPQGVNYEPWHWRYVGVDDARRAFYP
jgi:D-alanyl-D-alanine carboxypeptidase